MKNVNNLNELLAMETIENNMVYGFLKVDTDKQRIYIDTDNSEVNHSVLVSGVEDEEWDTETYDFGEWDEVQGVGEIKTYYILSEGSKVGTVTGSSKNDLLTVWLDENDFEYDCVDFNEKTGYYAMAKKDGHTGEIAISESETGTYTTWSVK